MTTSGAISVDETHHSHTGRSSSTGYLFECTRCGRQFAQTTKNSSLRQHNDPYGNRCGGCTDAAYHLICTRVRWWGAYDASDDHDG